MPTRLGSTPRKSGPRLKIPVPMYLKDRIFLDTPLALRRPIGVTVLGVWNYACAVLVLVFGVFALTWPRMIEAVLDLDPSSYAVDTRILIFGACVFLSLLSYLVGYAFMRLQNWVRVFTIAVSMFDLVMGGPHFGCRVPRRIRHTDLVFVYATVRAAFHTVAAERQPA